MANRKKSTFLKEENLLTLLSQNNFIVPEIQREYVWGENEKVIKGFLMDLKNKIGVCCANCNLPSSDDKINIGFLYSYKPDYVKIEHDRFLDENLIDGQQRFTTLFLLLFYCALKEGRKADFMALIRFEEKRKMSFDFRVRDLTKRFLLEFVEKTDNTTQLELIDQQTWFLKDYQNDVSIKSMRKALGYIQDIFSDNTKYYNHFINYVVFWHFKTEATSQGEELYITMNARGEELASNEVSKAALMIDQTELLESGKKWEDFQQFFWKNRKDNSNADKGFNGFLGCIAGLEYYLVHRKLILEKDTEKLSTLEKDIKKLLTLEKVEKYYNAFKYLLENKASLQQEYTYTAWVDTCLAEIWGILNSNDTDWFADYQDKNKSIERKKMVFIWSWLYYITKMKDSGDDIETIELYRILRFFYVRYNNNNRSVSTLENTVDSMISKGILDTSDNEMGDEETNPEEETDRKFRTTEEKQKYGYLQSQMSHPNIKEIESLIWEIEDHPWNLDGSDVGNINISHLLSFDEQLTFEYLQKVKNSFSSLFQSDTHILKTILLHYGDFWEDKSIYYKRYYFSNWKRNIRKPEFKKLISEIVDKTAEQHLEDLGSQFLEGNKNDILNAVFVLPEKPWPTKLIYYSLLIPYSELWQKGERVIIAYDAESSRLFKDENQIIYNSKGTFHSDNNYTDLWEKALEKYDNPLQELKDRLA